MQKARNKYTVFTENKRQEDQMIDSCQGSTNLMYLLWLVPNVDK